MNNLFKNLALVAFATTIIGVGTSYADTYRVSIYNNPELDSVLKIGTSGTGDVQIQNNSNYTLYMPYQEKQITIPALSERTFNMDQNTEIELSNAWGQQVYNWSPTSQVGTQQTANSESSDDFLAKKARWSDTITRVRSASNDTAFSVVSKSEPKYEAETAPKSVKGMW